LNRAFADGPVQLAVVLAEFLVERVSTFLKLWRRA
jgi:hypothetical protein